MTDIPSPSAKPDSKATAKSADKTDGKAGGDKAGSDKTGGTNVKLATGIAMGIGSAALVAALLYTNRGKKGGAKKD